MPSDAGILFTAFEPSGDAHAAPVIAALRRMRPAMPIWALGGPMMSAAGATLLHSTTADAAMLLGALTRARQHRRQMGQLRRWLHDHRLAALVPVDSPAANWSICKLIRRSSANSAIVHLIAPQLWAWAPWRIGRLRRLTDHALCLLPFEPDWFNSRGVKATFVGHPLFNRHQAVDPLTNVPDGAAKLALLPGSRRAEIAANWPMMLEVVSQLRHSFSSLHSVVAATDGDAAAQIERLTRRAGAADIIDLRVGQTDAILHWADAALVKSGTSTLHAAAAGCPMVVVYNVSAWGWHLIGRWLVQTRTFASPNLIAQWQGQGRIVTEFVPHFGRAAPVTAAVTKLLNDRQARQTQQSALQSVGQSFAGCDYAASAAEHILEAIDEKW